MLVARGCARHATSSAGTAARSRAIARGSIALTRSASAASASASRHVVAMGAVPLANHEPGGPSSLSDALRPAPVRGRRRRTNHAGASRTSAAHAPKSRSRGARWKTVASAFSGVTRRQVVYASSACAARAAASAAAPGRRGRARRRGGREVEDGEPVRERAEYPGDDGPTRAAARASRPPPTGQPAKNRALLARPAPLFCGVMPRATRRASVRRTASTSRRTRSRPTRGWPQAASACVDRAASAA